ncbi:T9SS C-terminal target domain-containing protein [Chryseobacterium nematophagum]|uniref:T9SS C-terminal target domain-containing protein n=1 Tax=Chryseobacterium nematophagum TaxID=2305228 RepID=A0A3M7TE50_9FLAO|nr:M36 family metallopeptidase [Chryseobacterium nematophagum]RNA60460.1 T9SS C-terminal target domain-containing protein [Chryseobacterium nematophagum]
MKKNYSAFTISLLLCSSMNHAQTLEYILQDYQKNIFPRYKRSDLYNFVIDNRDKSLSLKGEVIKLQQMYNGLPVLNAVSTALIKENKVYYYRDSFEKDYARADVSKPILTPEQAFEKIAKTLAPENKIKYSLLNFNDTYLKSDLPEVKQRLVYKKYKKDLILCYEFIVPKNKNFGHWDILINANTGEYIEKADLTNYCKFSKNFFNAADNVKIIYPQNKNFYLEGKNLTFMSADHTAYNVFALPIEAPTFGTRSVQTNPWILSSSPEGWHSDGTNHYTETKGNNTETFSADVDYTNQSFVNKTYVDGGNNRNFDFPFNPSSSVEDNLSASVSDLFYTVNMTHDIYYKLGFTETSKNFQKNNFGIGGLDNDPIEVVSVRMIGNNAGYDSTPEGTSPRLATYLYKNLRFLQYIQPVDAQSRKYKSIKSFFGPDLTTTGMIGDVKRCETIDACTPLTENSLTDKIGLMRFGNCEATVKVKNAQNAGAIAAIIYNDSSTNDMLPLQGDDPSITIPTVRIENTEGEYMNGLLSQGTIVSVKLVDDLTNEGAVNASLDKGIVIHEYTHGLSNRLTGTGFGCLNVNVSSEQMGEGWSDFYALMLTNRPEYNSATSRGHASYVEGEQADGLGSRPAKYSTSFAVNNYTYGMTNGMEAHDVGFVWATMLWDLHWNYAEKYGYSSNVWANTTNGSTRVLQLVTDALKLQACNPTFIDGREAILAADQSTTGGENKCMIWRTFAKRGLGTNASAGDKANINDQTEDFTVPAECIVLGIEDAKHTKNMLLNYPNPVKNNLYIKFPDNVLGKISIEIYDMSGKLVFSEDRISADQVKAISTGGLANGTYIIKAKGLSLQSVSKFIVEK